MKKGESPYKPEDKDRRMVEVMAGVGIPQEDIAKVVGITSKTLRKHFRSELETSSLKANARVVQTLYSLATSGKCPAATFFWCKTRMGFRETANLEVDVRERVDIRAVVMKAIEGQPEDARRQIARRLMDAAKDESVQ